MNDDGCHGGEAISAYEFMHNNDITDETCSIYQARGHDNGIECAPINVCKNCEPGAACFVPDQYFTYRVGEFAAINGEQAMMQEIYQRGPIACGIAVPDSLEAYTGGIYQDTTGDQNIVHDISVVGFGVENGVKYWVVRNSWGSHWGESGFVRVIRGVNNIAIETDCAYAVPQDTWTNRVPHKTTDAEKNDPKNAKYSKNGPYPEGMKDDFLGGSKHSCRRVTKAAFKSGQKKTETMPWEEIDTDALPANWDWRDVNGTNFLGWSKNQHIPQYCGSCWAQATTSSLGDRFNILLGDHNPTPIDLAAQVIVNCQAGGSCNGGDPSGVYEYAYETGIPDVSCEQYVAKNLDKDTCDAIDVCRDCRGPPPAEGESGQENCWAVDYKKYYVSNYYGLSGASKMKAEIYKNGPISCGISVTDKFEAYTSGIYSESSLFPMINHEIAVVGWGLDQATNTEYWIGRNSWGTYWGEQGFFRIKMHSDNLAIEDDCTAGIPSFTKASKQQELIQ